MAYRLVTLAKQAGFRGLFAGLGPRMVMTAGLVSGQFLLYGAIKDGAFPTISSSFPSPEIDHCRCSFGRPAWAGDPQGDIRCSVRSAVTCQLDVGLGPRYVLQSHCRGAPRRRYMSVELTRKRARQGLLKCIAEVQAVAGLLPRELHGSLNHRSRSPSVAAVRYEQSDQLILSGLCWRGDLETLENTGTQTPKWFAKMHHAQS